MRTRGSWSRSLNEAGYDTRDLSENEMAKLHVRHMVGGRARDVRHERPCRFEFPERPGALMQFLEALGGRWNISLFHYRNHGADFGRVLAAFEVPDEQIAEFRVLPRPARVPLPRRVRERRLPAVPRMKERGLSPRTGHLGTVPEIP